VRFNLNTIRLVLFMLLVLLLVFRLAHVFILV
jgi:hypothetical protein